MRFPRIPALIAIGALALFGLTTPARADRLCDTYPDRLSAAEIEAIPVQLKYGFPAGHAAALSRVRIANTADGALLGPRLSTQGARAVIEVPIGFRRFQCKLVRIQAYYMNGCCNRSVDTGRIVKACYDRTGDRRRCVEQLMDDVIARLEVKYPHDPKGLRELTDTAFQFALGHEAAHLILDDDGPAPGVVSELDDETAADLFALLGIVVQGSPPISALASQATLSMADATFDWGREPHLPGACRALIADRTVRTIGPEVGMIYRWLLDPGTYASERAKPRRVETLAVFIAGDTSRCRTPDPGPIDSVRRDFDRILAAIDSTGPEQAGSRNAERVVQRLMAVPLATGEGERLRTNIASLWVLSRVKIDQGDGSAETLRRNAARLDRLLGMFRPELMTSEAYGRLLVNRALSRFFQAPAGSDLTAQNARLARDLDLAERYYSGSGYVTQYRGHLAFMNGRCEEGRALYRRLLDDNPENAGLAQELRPYLAASTPAACADASAELRRSMRSKFGWTG
jgi:hypothetical protein